MFYSTSTGGFYDADIHDNMPLDVVEITKELHAQLIHGQATGLRIVADNSGHPILAARPALSPEEIWGFIKAERDRRKILGFQCAGHWYHSDAESKTQHLGNKDTARDQIAAGALMDDPLRDPITNQPIIWKTMSGVFVPLTCGLAIDIVAAGKSAEFQVFSAAEMHRAQMVASPDPAAYDFFVGWPAVFGE